MSPDSTHSQDIVTAVVVAHDGAAWLPRVAQALAAQTRPVQRVVAVDTGSTDRSGAMLAQAFGRAAVFGMDRGTGYGVAVAKALRHRAANTPIPPAGGPPGERTEWVWLLHDDCEPAPDALEQLLAGARRAPAAAVFGPKVRDWSDHEVLLEAGLCIDRAGRRVTGIEPREVDQGQHDGDRDAMSVSSAGLLARRDVWEHVGGFDPGMRLFREDTDFCWRVQAAGFRVRVVTDAVVYHVEATARNRRQASAAPRRRRQDRHNALMVLAGNLPARPMLSALAGNLVLSTLRTMFFLLAKRPGAAVDELAAYTSVVAHPLRLLAARRRRAAGRQAAYSRMGPNDLPPGRSFRMLFEFATSTLSKSQRAEAIGSHHATEDPTDDDSLLTDTGLVQRLLTNPGVLLFLTLTVVALVAERSLLGSTPLGGGALVPAWGGASGLWSEYLHGFHTASIGTAASTPPYVAVIALLATLLGGKPWLAVDLILLGCVPLAGITAFLATRRATRLTSARLVGALAYALLPVGIGAVAAGRLGTAVLLVLLPLAGALAARIFTSGRRRARRAAWATALVVAVMTAFVPLFWLITVVAMAVGVLLAGRRRAGRAVNAAIVAVAPVALLIPWVLTLAAHPGRLLLEAGLAQPGMATPGLPARSLLLLSPGGPGLPPFWVTAGLAIAATAVLLASGRRGPVLAGWTVGVTGLIAAAVVSRFAVSQAGVAAPVPAWPGPALAVAGAGLLLAVVAATDGLPARLPGRGWRSAPGLAVLGLGVLACSAPALAAGYWVASGVRGPVHPVAGPVLPEFVAVSSDSGLRPRTLVLQAAPAGGVTYSVLRDSDPLIGSPDLTLPDSAQRALSLCVATLTAPAGGAAVDQGRALASFGIGYVLVPAPVNAGLVTRLDGVAGLRPVSVTGQFDLWRVAGTSARITVTEPNGTVVPVSSGAVSVAGARLPAAGGTLHLAEPYGGWSASVNGHPLTALAAPVNGWAQGFRLPAGGGTLSLSRDELGRYIVVGLEALAVLVVAGLGLPGSRASEAAEEAALAEAEAARAGQDEPAGEDEPAEPGRRARRGRGRAAGGPGRRASRRGRAAPEPALEEAGVRPAVPVVAAPGVRGAVATDPGDQTAVHLRNGAAVGRHGHRDDTGGQSGPGRPADLGRERADLARPAGRRRRPAGDQAPPGRWGEGGPRDRQPGPAAGWRDGGPPGAGGDYPPSRPGTGGQTGPRRGFGAGAPDDGDGPERAGEGSPFGRGAPAGPAAPVGRGDLPGGRRGLGRRAAPVRGAGGSAPGGTSVGGTSVGGTSVGGASVRGASTGGASVGGYPEARHGLGRRPAADAVPGGAPGERPGDAGDDRHEDFALPVRGVGRPGRWPGSRADRGQDAGAAAPAQGGGPAGSAGLSPLPPLPQRAPRRDRWEDGDPGQDAPRGPAGFPGRGAGGGLGAGGGTGPGDGRDLAAPGGWGQAPDDAGRARQQEDWDRARRDEWDEPDW